MATPLPPPTLKLMLVDQSSQRRAILEKILRDNGYTNVFSTSGLDDLFALVATVKPDVVLIELDSPKRDTLEQLREIRQRQPTPVVMFAQDQDAQTVHAAVDSGVCAYMVDSVDRVKVKPAIDLAMATFAAYRRLRNEADKYRTQLDSRKEIDLAKSLLMRHERLGEAEAHRMLRKMAMDSNRKLHRVALDVISSFKNKH
ncbi:putative transcriptional regulatory protein pdtaR [Stieleria neptunia]|uniref:Putative transcriptional regulatory protein pdtaR n=1 Tax=Stieleria neptunia TaxID=2527979 RepID=A0A518HVS2_9BACT|nr:ANTAR domain-containing protein [Stieleria neptunia]QDV44913.1 putative transcriptional regulatory protein pdtaR [Stieleria neptunia]